MKISGELDALFAYKDGTKDRIWLSTGAWCNDKILVKEVTNYKEKIISPTGQMKVQDVVPLLL